MSLRFAHTSDWHIGRAFHRFPPQIQTYLQDQRLLTVTNLARWSSENQIDAILVAGDVFDRQDVEAALIERLLVCLESFPGRWIFIPGNHDHQVSLFWNRQDFPQNVIRLTEPKQWLDPDGRFSISSAPFREYEDDSLAAFGEIPRRSDVISLGLGHGSV